MHRLPALVLAAALCVPVVAPAADAKVPVATELATLEAGDTVPDRITVLFREELSTFDLADLERAYHLTRIDPAWSPSHVSFRTADPDGAVATLARDPRVLVASRVTVVRALTSDPLYDDQWYLRNTGQRFLIGIARLIIPSQSINALISAFPATAGNDVRWEEARALAACSGLPCEGRGVVVAVIDSGADPTHADLQGQLHPASRSFVYEPSTDYSDVNGHGTFVAGLIGARRENGAGITGVAPSAQLLALESSIAGSFLSDAVFAALQYATANGAGVINMSFGGDTVVPEFQALLEQAAASSPAPILVAAAGNSGDEDNPVMYPASYPHVVSVGSYDPDGTWTPFSEWNDAVDVSAPGGLVTSLRAAGTPTPVSCGGTPYGQSLTYEPSNACTFTDAGVPDPTGTYRNGSGTSFAAPIVAGAAALAKERWPRLTSDGFEALVRATADDAGTPGPDAYYGAGKLNLARLLAHNFPVETASARAQFSRSPVTSSGSDRTQLGVQIVNLEGASDVTLAEVDLSPVGLGAHEPLVLQQDATGVLSYATAELVVPATAVPGSYPITATIADRGGSTGTVSATLTVTPPGASAPEPSPGETSTVLPPAVAITGPERGEDFTTRRKTVTLRGTVNDAVATLTVDGTEQAIAPGTTAWEATVRLDEGENAITVVARDVTGTAEARTSVTITRDSEAPDDVEDLETAPSGSQTRLTWSKADDDSGVEGYHVYRVIGEEFEELGVTRSRSFLTSEPGPYAVTAEDEAGNEADPSDAEQVAGGRDTGFTDVPRTHPASVAIVVLRERGIVQGNAGAFRPNDPVTRAEFAKMLAGAMGASGDPAAVPFRDVPRRSSFAGAIAAVTTHGWATGQQGLFSPSRPVTRMEAGTMIVRAAGLPASGDAGFTDVRPGMEMGVAAALRTAGIARGHGGHFLPYRALTRSEAAVMLVGLLARVGS